jgi:hypothetical protein
MIACHWGFVLVLKKGVFIGEWFKLFGLQMSHSVWNEAMWNWYSDHQQIDRLHYS